MTQDTNSAPRVVRATTMPADAPEVAVAIVGAGACGLTTAIRLRQAGIDWPVSCRNGTCRSCIGRLVAGTVAYDIPWPGLSLEEKRDGYCLPCIARPLCDFVIQRT